MREGSGRSMAWTSRHDHCDQKVKTISYSSLSTVGRRVVQYAGLTSGVVPGVQFLHALAGHVGVYLGRGDVGMSQQKLHHSQIGPVV